MSTHQRPQRAGDLETVPGSPPTTLAGPSATDCLLLAALSTEAIGQADNAVEEPQVGERGVVSRIMNTTGEQLTLVPLLPSLLPGVARLLELKHSSGGSDEPPKLSRRFGLSAHRNICYDTREAREQWDWRPGVTLEEGPRRTLDREAQRSVAGEESDDGFGRRTTV